MVGDIILLMGLAAKCQVAVLEGLTGRHMDAAPGTGQHFLTDLRVVPAARSSQAAGASQRRLDQLPGQIGQDQDDQDPEDQSHGRLLYGRG